MKRWVRAVATSAVTLALVSMTACELDLDLTDIGEQIENSKDAQTRRAAEAAKKAAAVAEANKARDEFLKDPEANAEKLDEAIAKNPDDPELRAYKKVERDIYRESLGREGRSSSLGLKEGLELLDAVAKSREAARRAKDPPVVLPNTPEARKKEESEVRRETSLHLMEALARMMIGTTTGSFGNVPNVQSNALWDDYCNMLTSHEERWPADINTTVHRGQYNPPPCTPRRRQ